MHRQVNSYRPSWNQVYTCVSRRVDMFRAMGHLRMITTKEMMPQNSFWDPILDQHFCFCAQLLNHSTNMLTLGRSCSRRLITRRTRCAHRRRSNSYASCFFLRKTAILCNFVQLSTYVSVHRDVNFHRLSLGPLGLVYPRCVDIKTPMSQRNRFRRSKVTCYPTCGLKSLRWSKNSRRMTTFLFRDMIRYFLVKDSAI